MFEIIDADDDNARQPPAITPTRDSIGVEFTRPVEQHVARHFATWDDAKIQLTYRAMQDATIQSRTRIGDARLLETFLNMMKSALDKRERRLQAQMPLDGRSILSFLAPRRNERLLNLALHPVHFHPRAQGMRFDAGKYDSLPLSIQNFDLGAVNRLLQAIHIAFAAANNSDAWVERYRPVLQQFRVEFGLDRPFEPFVIRQPHVPSGSIVVWDSYHATEDHFVDAQGRDRTTNEFYGTMFLDYCPRRLFSERIWHILYQCHMVSVVDVGAGPSLYRGGQWTYRYLQSTNTLAGLQQVPQIFHHYFGAPRPAEIQAASFAPVNEIAEVFNKGYVVTRVPAPNLDQAYSEAWREFRNFMQWIMLDMERDFVRNVRGKVVIPNRQMPPLVVGGVVGIIGQPGLQEANINLIHPTGVDLELLTAVLGGTIGRAKAATVLGFGGTNAFWRRKNDGMRGAGGQFLSKISIDSGMGVGTSFYDGKAHLEVQVALAPTFELLYGEPVVIIPERFRIKLNTSWHNWHIDHAPLPDAILGALSALGAAPATEDDDDMEDEIE